LIIAYNRIYKSISKDFNNTFPIGTTFIPASRAIAAITDNTDFLDPFVVRFIKNCKWLLNRIKNHFNNDIYDVLHIKSITHDERHGLIITLPNDCKIQPEYLSSGQQELLYLLLTVGDLRNDLRYPLLSFTISTSVFVEEPEAHLFPMEQKHTMEFIVETFRMAKKNKNKLVRFFITTHSPYILNVVTTMMNRGHLKMKLDELKDTPIDSLHYFNKGEISAYSIDDDRNVRTVVSEDETYLIAEKIDNISQIIFDEANSVNDRLAEIKAWNK